MAFGNQNYSFLPLHPCHFHLFTVHLLQAGFASTLQSLRSHEIESDPLVFACSFLNTSMADISIHE